MNARLRESLRRGVKPIATLCIAVAVAFGSFVAATVEADESKDSITVAEARERAKLLHAVYAATLDSMHHHYFRRELPVLPARAMEDVFAALDRHARIKTGWIAVNTKAMSIDHEPKSAFEKQAAKAIAAGKGEWELVEDGVYRRASAIPLGAGCVHCHMGLFNKTPQTQRFAGLVISIPLNSK